MMRMNKILTALLTIVILVASACEKEKADRSGDITQENGWALIEVRTNLDELAPKVVATLSGDQLQQLGMTPEQVTGLLVENAVNIETIFPCEDDDTYYFNDDGTMTYDKGGRACFPNAPEDEGFFRGTTTWSRDENRLTITDEEETYEYTILELSDTILDIELETVFQEQSLGIYYDEEMLRVRLRFFARD